MCSGGERVGGRWSLCALEPCLGAINNNDNRNNNNNNSATALVQQLNSHHRHASRPSCSTSPLPPQPLDSCWWSSHEHQPPPKRIKRVGQASSITHSITTLVAVLLVSVNLDDHIAWSPTTPTPCAVVFLCKYRHTIINMGYAGWVGLPVLTPGETRRIIEENRISIITSIKIDTPHEPSTIYPTTTIQEEAHAAVVVPLQGADNNLYERPCN